MSKYNRGMTEEEKEAMATRKKAEKVETGKVETKERAAVGRERRLALALQAVLDATEKMVLISSTDEPLSFAVIEATKLLDSLGYAGIESTAKRVARINEELNTAIAAGDGARIAELGKELQKAQAGKFHRAAQESVNGSPEVQK